MGNESTITVRKILHSNKCCIVPDYQRSYSWETPDVEHKHRKTHTDVFLNDFEEYMSSKSNDSYYLGHFLFKKENGEFFIIDGQQRLTTTVIFLSALFSVLEKKRQLSENEIAIKNEMVIDINSKKARVKTVEYDDTFLKKYAITQVLANREGLTTQSQERIADAFDYYFEKLTSKDEKYLTDILNVISNASCTANYVESESTAVQMFIFQNNRGKKPTALEVLKATFMNKIMINRDSDMDESLKDVVESFKEIYRNMSKINDKTNSINEDDILLYTWRIHENNLLQDNVLEEISKKLKSDESFSIKKITQELEDNFKALARFFGNDQVQNFNIHSFIGLNIFSLAMPFILKAYAKNIGIEEIGHLCKTFEAITVRQGLVGSNRRLTKELSDEFQAFDGNNTPVIIDAIRQLFIESHWDDNMVSKALDENMTNMALVKFILWKYENHLKSKKVMSGYAPARFDDFKKYEIEHIAPQTYPGEVSHRYGNYSKDGRKKSDFERKCIPNIGNLLLISKSHNCHLQNDIFPNKHKTYNYLLQQEEVCEIASGEVFWKNDQILERKRRITDFIKSLS